MSPADVPSPDGAGRAGAGRPSALRSVNLAVRLLCELGLLVALAVWGFHVGSGTAAKVALGLGAPLLAAVIWGLWVAPASRRRLRPGGGRLRGRGRRQHHPRAQARVAGRGHPHGAANASLGP